MILRDTSNRTAEGNLGGETITMGISDIRLIIDRLTDLYSDRELACIREYSTNALDAHIEAGISTPIEVSTPGPLRPFLTIRDFGVGLTVEDIREIYSKYGASTKRNTNDQTGALGLGCKSALSYTDQFTVTSVRDGVRIQVVVSRDPQKGATMQVVDTSSTSEPNGTTILIPARANNLFEQKAKQFFRFWEPGTVKLNGAEPQKLPGASWVSDDIAILDGSQSYIVMGGVPYPTSDLRHGLGYYKGIAAFVKIGDVDFAPSREGLMDTDVTTKTLRRVEAEFKSKLHDAIRKDVADAPSAAAAVQRRLKWARELPHGMMPANVGWRGKDIPSQQSYPEGAIITQRHARKMSHHEKLRPERGIPMETAQNALYVTGFDYASFTATVRKKIEKWIEDHDTYDFSTFSHYILLPYELSKVDTSWLDGDLKSVDWPTLKAIKLPRANNGGAKLASGRIAGSYDIWENGDWNEGVPGDDIDTQHPVYWMFANRYYDGRRTAEYLKDKHPKGYTLVHLRSGREEKFKRNFPNCQQAERVIEADFKSWVATVNKDDAMALSIRQNLDRRFEQLPLDRLKDPEIAKVAAIRNRDTSKLEAKIQAWSLLGFHFHPDKVAMQNPLDKYILLPDAYYFRRYKGEQMEHLIRYMNCEYAHQAQGSK